MKIIKSESGFTSAHFLLILVLFGIISFTGWKVYKTKIIDSHDKSYYQAPKNDLPLQSQNLLPDGFVEYKNEELGFKFAYPKEWGQVQSRVRSQANGYNCQDQELIKEAHVTGAVYNLIFSENQEKSLQLRSKDFASNSYYPCITLAGSIAPKHFENAKGQGFYAEAGTEYIAESSNYECSRNAGYYLYAVKALNTPTINGISVTLHRISNPYDDCDEHIDLLEKTKSTLSDEDKKIMNTFQVL